MKQTINIAAFITACRKLNIPKEEIFSQLVVTLDYSGLQGYTDLRVIYAVTIACVCTHTMHARMHTHPHTHTHPHAHIHTCTHARTHTHTHTLTHTQLCSAGDIKELKDPLRVITCLQRVLETAQ